MEHFIFASPGVAVISTAEAARLAALPDGDAARLYLYILGAAGAYDENAASAALGLSKERLLAAFKVLKNGGFLKSEGEKAPLRSDEPPEYSPSEVARIIEGDPQFRGVVDYTQNQLGRVLGGADTTILLRIYAWLGFSAEALCMLVRHMTEEHQKKGRAPTIRQIEKEAYIWERAGVSGAEEADAYLRHKSERSGAIFRIAAMLGIRDRRLSATEEKYIEAWIGFGFDDDAVYKAYDITVVKTGALTWKFMDKVLSNWHEKEMHTIDEIERAESAHTKAPAKTAAGQQQGVSSYEMEAIRRNMRRLEDKRGASGGR